LPILGSLAVMDVNLHPLGVDVGDPQIGRFGEPHPGCVECRQKGSLLEILGTRE
jgi:hypothetical protein